jgi:TM2 domain-containing membrane protein YozV
MSQNAEIFDLGEVERAIRQGRQQTTQTAAPSPAPTRRPAAVRRPMLQSFVDGQRVALFASDFSRSLSLFIPGATQMFQGRIALGFFYVTALAFMGTLTLAVLGTIDRLAPTLVLLGASVAIAFWVLVIAFVLAAALHLAAVWTAQDPAADRDRPLRHPLVPALASLIVPGWGQILNGDRMRAMLFLGSCWLVAGVWIASSQSATDLVNVYIPIVAPWEQSARGPLILWTLKLTVPVVLWSLAVYDAVASAAGHRRSR